MPGDTVKMYWLPASWEHHSYLHIIKLFWGSIFKLRPVMHLTTYCISFEERPLLRYWKINMTVCVFSCQLLGWCSLCSVPLKGWAGMVAMQPGALAAISPCSSASCCKMTSMLAALSWRLNVFVGFIPLMKNEGQLSAEIWFPYAHKAREGSLFSICFAVGKLVWLPGLLCGAACWGNFWNHNIKAKEVWC